MTTYPKLKSAGVRGAREQGAREVRYTAEEWRDLTDLRKHWNDWCDRDPFEGSDTFIDRMAARGYAQTRKVRRADLEAPFASERGIEMGSVLWELTEKGRAALSNQQTMGDGK